MILKELSKFLKKLDTAALLSGSIRKVDELQEVINNSITFNKRDQAKIIQLMYDLREAMNNESWALKKKHWSRQFHKMSLKKL